MSSNSGRMKMTTFCCVNKCSHRGQRDKCSFYRIPKALTNPRLDPAVVQLSKDRREKVIQAINRKNWKPTEYNRICSCHYIDGKPAKLMDKLNPDWIPTQKLGYTMKKVTGERYTRSRKREEAKRASTSESNNKNNVIKRGKKKEDIEMGVQCQTDVKMTDIADLQIRVQQLRHAIELQKEDAAKKLEEHKSVIHKKECNAILELAEANYKWKQKIRELELQLAKEKEKAKEEEKAGQIAPNVERRVESQLFTEQSLKSDEKMLHFYTGVRYWSTFVMLFELVRPLLTDGLKLSKFQKFVVFLVKLRLNLLEEDLAYRFNDHRVSIGKAYLEMLQILQLNSPIRDKFISFNISLDLLAPK